MMAQVHNMLTNLRALGVMEELIGGMYGAD